MSTVSTLRDLSERILRPGLLGLLGRAQEKRCREDLARYFRRLTTKINALDFGSLANENKDTACNYAEMEVDKVLREESDALGAVLSINLFQAFMAGSKQTVFHETSVVPEIEKLDKLGASGKEAADYAAKRAAKLVTDINRTTRNQIADAVSEGIEERLGVQKLARMIREIVDEMTKSRTEMIATTEMNDAMSEAALRKIKRLDISYKQLILSDQPCSICESIEAAGPVPVDEPFVDENGEEYDRTPIHPNCRCATTGARAPEGEDA